MSSVIDYPFSFSEKVCTSGPVGTEPVYISADMSSDSQFFVATGVLSMLYCLFIIAVYGFVDQMYKDKPEFPMADFILTTLLAIFWLSGSAAWSNGTSSLKSMTDIDLVKHCSADYKNCEYMRTSFSSLNISLVSHTLRLTSGVECLGQRWVRLTLIVSPNALQLLGYLNFFLWASDLWFLYKETMWFQNRAGGPPMSSGGGNI